MTDSTDHVAPLAFLLSQVGAHASAGFAARLEPLGLHPCDAGLLVAVSRGAGLSQQDLAELLGANPSRLVVLVDRLEERGLLERRAHAGDRRVHALFTTAQGEAVMAAIARACAAHEKSVTSGLTPTDRRSLIRLLRKVAAAQNLAPGVHPGFAAALAAEAAAPKKAVRRRRSPAARTPARRIPRD